MHKMRVDFFDELRRQVKNKFRSANAFAKIVGGAHTTALQYLGRRGPRRPNPKRMTVQTLERITEALKLPIAHWFTGQGQTQAGDDLWGELIAQRGNLSTDEYILVRQLLIIIDKADNDQLRGLTSHLKALYRSVLSKK